MSYTNLKSECIFVCLMSYENSKFFFKKCLTLLTTTPPLPYTIYFITLTAMNLEYSAYKQQ